MLGNLFSPKKHEPEVIEPVRQGMVSDQGSVPQAPDKQIVGSTMQPNQRQDLSILSHLDSRSQAVLNQAQDEAKRIKQALIEPDQLLFGLLYDSDIFQLMSQFSVDVSKLSHELQERENVGTFAGQPVLSEDSKKVFEEAYSKVKGREIEFISPEDLLIALFLFQPEQFYKLPEFRGKKSKSSFPNHQPLFMAKSLH